jgi:hypothetical protein
LLWSCAQSRAPACLAIDSSSDKSRGSFPQPARIDPCNTVRAGIHTSMHNTIKCGDQGSMSHQAAHQDSIKGQLVRQRKAEQRKNETSYREYGRQLKPNTCDTQRDPSLRLHARSIPKTRLRPLTPSLTVCACRHRIIRGHSASVVSLRYLSEDLPAQNTYPHVLSAL